MYVIVEKYIKYGALTKTRELNSWFLFIYNVNYIYIYIYKHQSGLPLYLETWNLTI